MYLIRLSLNVIHAFARNFVSNRCSSDICTKTALCMWCFSHCITIVWGQISRVPWLGFGGLCSIWLQRKCNDDFIIGNPVGENKVNNHQHTQKSAEVGNFPFKTLSYNAHRQKSEKHLTIEYNAPIPVVTPMLLCNLPHVAFKSLIMLQSWLVTKCLYSKL